MAVLQHWHFCTDTSGTTLATMELVEMACCTLTDLLPVHQSAAGGFSDWLGSQVLGLSLAGIADTSGHLFGHFHEVVAIGASSAI